MDQTAVGGSLLETATDPYRSFVFPNRVRLLRQAAGIETLLMFSRNLPDIAYIRLSKIERGEVVPRVEEFRKIADALKVDAEDLFIDIDDSAFQIEDWAAPFFEADAFDEDEEQLTVLVGAAIRNRRVSDPDLTISSIGESYGLPPVTLSRLEHAQKPFSRWKPHTMASVCRFLGVTDEEDLRRAVMELLRSGALDDSLRAIQGPRERLAETARHVAELKDELRQPVSLIAPAGTSPPRAPSQEGTPGILPVLGVPVDDGLIDPQPTGSHVAVPAGVGPQLFALRVCRPVLGLGLPGSAVLFVDPSRFPQPGNLCVQRTEKGLRVLAVRQERDGTLIACSVKPELRLDLGEVDPATLSTAVAACLCD